MADKPAASFLQALTTATRRRVVRVARTEPVAPSVVTERSEMFVEFPLRTTAESAAADLACLAVSRAQHHGTDLPSHSAADAHPRFAEAVAAAGASCDKEQAFEAALRILDGPEALEAFGLTP